MRTTTIATFAALLIAGWNCAQAAPQIDAGTIVTRKQGTPYATISYSLSGEPAVVTIDVLVGGVSGGAAARQCVTGDVNRLLQPGGHKAILLSDGPLASVADKDVSVAVRAWATNCPPDYLVISLTNKNEAARYYLTADDVPDGVTHERYKKSHLVMRKIPAANVEWRMGSPTMEIGRSGRLGGVAYENYETAHYVRLTEDFYIGIYPVTYRQHVNAVGSFSYGMWANSTYADYRTDDMPLAPTQFVSLRSWMHDNDKGCNTNCSTIIKYWPHDGHEIDEAKSPKCEMSGGTYTPYLRSWRDNIGFEFDLPTDAQWEFACRAGCPLDYSNWSIYNANAAAYGWFRSNSATEVGGESVLHPHPVGTRLPNDFGLYDMHGNINEWCLDWNDTTRPFAPDPVTDPWGYTSGEGRITRSGCYNYNVPLCRSARRGKDPPQDPVGVIGFRLACPAAAFAAP